MKKLTLFLLAAFCIAATPVSNNCCHDAAVCSEELAATISSLNNSSKLLAIQQDCCSNLEDARREVAFCHNMLSDLLQADKQQDQLLHNSTMLVATMTALIEKQLAEIAALQQKLDACK